MDEKILNRLEAWMRKGKAPPLRIEIWPTYRCNLKCRFCRETFPKVTNEISEGKLLSLLIQLAKFGAEECFIGGGGEPFMRKNVTLSLIKTSKKLGLLCFVNTNGSLLLEKDIRKIVYFGLDEIAVSIHGPDAITHDNLVNKRGAFEKVKRAIQLLNKIKKEMGKDTPKISIWTVLTNKNFDKIQSMIKLAHEYEASTLLFFSMRVNFPSANKFRMREKEINKFMEIVDESKNLLKKYKINSNLLEFREEKFIEDANNVDKILLSDIGQKKDFFTIPCYEPWYYITITPTGKIGPCAALTMESPLSINSGKIEEMWYGEYFKQIREKLFQHEIINMCKKCCIDKIFESARIRTELRNRDKLRNKTLKIANL
jgi:MoaA/NifB/PqqE/SkfB family radical SAM enzyme